MSAEFKSTTPDMEPVSASTAMPIWLVTGTLLLLLGSAVYFDRHGGWFEPKVYAPYTSVAEINKWQPSTDGPNLSNGKLVFENNCAICHGTDGAGKPGQFPPLAGSEWVNAEGVNRIIRIPLLGLSGPIEVKGQQWNASMPNVASLSDKNIADALSYIRSSWGNKASPVSEQQVQAVRKEIGNRSQQLSGDELKKTPEKLSGK